MSLYRLIVYSAACFDKTVSPPLLILFLRETFLRNLLKRFSMVPISDSLY